jgi:hypothetical protein
MIDSIFTSSLNKFYKKEENHIAISPSQEVVINQNEEINYLNINSQEPESSVGKEENFLEKSLDKRESIIEENNNYEKVSENNEDILENKTDSHHMLKSPEYEAQRKIANNFIFEIFNSADTKFSQKVQDEHIINTFNNNTNTKVFNTRLSKLESKMPPVDMILNPIEKKMDLKQNSVLSSEEKVNNISRQLTQKSAQSKHSTKENKEIFDKNINNRSKIDNNFAENASQLKKEEQVLAKGGSAKKSIKTFDKEELKKIEDEINDDSNFQVNLEEIVSNEKDEGKEEINNEHILRTDKEESKQNNKNDNHEDQIISNKVKETNIIENHGKKIEKSNNTETKKLDKIKELNNNSIQKENLFEKSSTKDFKNAPREERLLKKKQTDKNLDKKTNLKIAISNDNIKLVNKALENKVHENKSNDKIELNISPKFKSAISHNKSKMNFFNVKMSETPVQPVLSMDPKDTSYKVMNKTGYLYKKENIKTSEKLLIKPYSNYGSKVKSENFSLEDTKNKVDFNHF